MEQNTKDFKAYKRREIRMSEKTWNKLRSAKIKSGEKWNPFIEKLLNKQK